MKDMSEVKKTIDELKELVLVMHRNAGHLDGLIQEVENCYDETLDNGDSVKYLNSMVGYFSTHRYDYKCKFDIFNKIDQRENELWSKLIELTNEEEESQ